MEFGFTIAAYAVAAVLFILSLGGLSGQESAKRAVWYGIVGMAIAVVATLMGPGQGLGIVSIVLIALGAAVGYQLATKVQMTQMPELVAIMHSLVGLAAVFVGFNADIMINNMSALFVENGGVLGAVGPDGYTAIGLPKEIYDGLSSFGQLIAKKSNVEINILKVELVLGIWIGAVTFTGSVIAYGKTGGQGGHIGQEVAGRSYAECGCGGFVIALYRDVSRWLGQLDVGAFDASGAVHRLSPYHGDRRGGHARGCLDAEQLFRLGGGGDWFLTWQ